MYTSHMMTMLRSFFVLLVAFANVAASASDICIPRTDVEPGLCPANLPPIKRIVITENAQSSTDQVDPPEDCSKVIVNERTVRRFFTRAKLTAPWTSWHYEIPYSPCYATGTLTFKDGRTATWKFYRSMSLGYLDIPGYYEPLQMYCIDCLDP